MLTYTLRDIISIAWVWLIILAFVLSEVSDWPQPKQKVTRREVRVVSYWRKNDS